MLGLDLYQIVISLIGAFLIGISKSGIKGIGIINVTLMALVFGAKSSTGIILPLLMTGDIMAVIYYKKHSQWKLLKMLLPYVAIGVVIGAYYGKDLPEETFKIGMASIILVSVAMMYLSEKYQDIQLLKTKGFGITMGILAGITTMIGNLAGAFANVFFLAMRLPKNQFIGTAAWLFFIINIFKLPFHIFSWETINADSVLVDLWLIPAVIIGFFCGVRIVKLINEKLYRNLILIMTALGAIIIFIR